MVIFSVAGFDELEPEGPDTDRAIANVMVTGLAGFYEDVGTHKRGREGLPLLLRREEGPQAPRGPAEVLRGVPAEAARPEGCERSTRC